MLAQFGNKLLPWQQTVWSQLMVQVNSGHLPHALLLHGHAGVGKNHLALLLAHYLLCNDKQEQFACGQCKTCLLLQAATHPDLFYLQPEVSGKAIKVDAIRQLLQQFHQKSYQQGYKIAIIAPAEAMNRAAANALLKTLEEPGEQSLLILISDNASQLPATIRSRCQAIYLPPVAQEQAQPFLQAQAIAPTELALLSQFCQGAPLQALSLFGSEQWQQRQQLLQGLTAIYQQQLDPISLAQTCQKFQLDWLLQCLVKWVADIIRWQYIGEQSPLFNSDQRAVIADISHTCSILKLYQWLDKLNQAQRLVNASINPNSQLLLEDLFCRWARICRG